MLKYLRIAVTVLSLTACVLLVALWVRSYWRTDYAWGWVATNHTFHLISREGRWCFAVDQDDETDFDKPIGIRFGYIFLPPVIEPTGRLGFGGSWFDVRHWSLIAPHWFLVLFFAAATATHWLPWYNRFSLRTLLIATTMVAVGMGAIVLLN
jgi:hypothetical protein